MKSNLILITLVGVLTLDPGCSSVGEKASVAATAENTKLPTIQKLESLEFDFKEVVGNSRGGQPFYLGGFSGLFIDRGASGEQNLTLWSLTDRGPNGGEIPSLIGVGRNARSFMIPEFAPRLIKLELDNLAFKVKLVSLFNFMADRKKKMSGLPILRQTKKNRAYTETASDSFGSKVNADPNGMDSEAVCIDKAGNFWVGEEYGPDLLKFDSHAILLKRFRAGKELPILLQNRRMNRGFEGIACSGTKIYAILQSPIKTEDAKSVLNVPMIEIDLSSEKVSGIYNYVLENEKSDKIGDISVLPDGKLLVLEQNGKTGIASQRKVFKISLSNSEISDKELVVDLSATELNQSEKIEGIAAIDNTTLLLVSDNDFGMTGEVDLVTGVAVTDSSKKTRFYRVHLNQKMW